MKKTIFTLSLMVVVAAIAIYSLQAPTPTSKIDDEPKKPEVATKRKVTLIPSETMPTKIAAFEPAAEAQPDPREALLDTLYQGISITERLEAARQLAAQGTETSFRDLAMFIAAAEENGHASLLQLAGQVSEILGKMSGPDIEAVATELAYSPTSLVAEAAVNAAISAKGEPLQPIAGTMNSEGQQEFDTFAQQLKSGETAPVE